MLHVAALLGQGKPYIRSHLGPADQKVDLSGRLQRTGPAGPQVFPETKIILDTIHK